MKLYVVDSAPEFQLTAFSTRGKAAAFVAANPGARIMTNSGPKAAKAQAFCDVVVAAGDTIHVIHVPLYFSDLTGESYIGGAFATEEEAENELRRTGTWKMSEQEKHGSGELHMRKMVLVNEHAE